MPVVLLTCFGCSKHPCLCVLVPPPPLLPAIANTPHNRLVCVYWCSFAQIYAVYICRLLVWFPCIKPSCRVYIIVCSPSPSLSSWAGIPAGGSPISQFLQVNKTLLTGRRGHFAFTCQNAPRQRSLPLVCCFMGVFTSRLGHWTSIVFDWRPTST